MIASPTKTTPIAIKPNSVMSITAFQWAQAAGYV
jgi:hypothetical protein